MEYGKEYVLKFYENFVKIKTGEPEEYEKGRKAIGKLLNKIFGDVKEFKDGRNRLFKVEELYNGMYKTMGGYFKNHWSRGILNFKFDSIETNLGFGIKLADDGFYAYDSTTSGYLPIKEFNDAKYQKRYIAAMYELFGDEYQKHCEKLLQDKKEIIENINLAFIL